MLTSANVDCNWSSWQRRQQGCGAAAVPQSTGPEQPQAGSGPCPAPARYFAGSWAVLPSLLSSLELAGRYDLVLTAETIYNPSDVADLLLCIKRVGRCVTGPCKACCQLCRILLMPSSWPSSTDCLTANSNAGRCQSVALRHACSACAAHQVQRFCRPRATTSGWAAALLPSANWSRRMGRCSHSECGCWAEMATPTGVSCCSWSGGRTAPARHARRPAG